MKRKKAGRKTRKTPPAVAAKPLRDLGGAVLNRVPYSPQTEIYGISLPPDLEPAVRYYTGIEREGLQYFLEVPGFGEPDEPAIVPDGISEDGWHEIRQTLERCFRQGFFLALLRYADDLKRSAEAAPLLEGLRKAAHKGAAARREQAEPNRKAVCKRFRELRKTIPKKTARYLKIAGELGMSDRHVQRIVNAADLD